MERCFIVSKESELHKDLDKYNDLVTSQRTFINRFFNEYGIESDLFLISGNGSVNVPFDERGKSDIKLRIKPTENDIEKYGKVLSKPNEHGLCSFKKNSKLAKEFAQKCIDEKIVINAYKPRIGDYFKSIGFYGCTVSSFRLDDVLYLKVHSDFLKEDDTPDGFTEIRKSQYYKATEELENKK